MKIYLFHLDPDRGLRLIHKIPEHKIDEDQIESLKDHILEKIDELKLEERLHIPLENSTNYIFNVNSGWSDSGLETMVLSLMFQYHMNTHIYEALIEDFIEKIQTEEDIYKAVFVSPEEDETKWREIPYSENEKSDIMLELGKIKELMSDLYFSLQQEKKKNDPEISDILIMGESGVGKTEILHRLLHKTFTQDCGPNCDFRKTSPMIFSMLIDSIDTVIFDVGTSSDSLRNVMSKESVNPGGLVYVIDANPDAQVQKHQINHFEGIMETFYSIWNKQQESPRDKSMSKTKSSDKTENVIYPKKIPDDENLGEGKEGKEGKEQDSKLSQGKKETMVEEGGSLVDMETKDATDVLEESRGKKERETDIHPLTAEDSEKIPLLFIINKIDKYPDYDLESMEKLYKPFDYPVNYHIAAISAKTNKGLEIAFRWLFKRINLEASVPQYPTR